MRSRRSWGSEASTGSNGRLHSTPSPGIAGEGSAASGEAPSAPVPAAATNARRLTRLLMFTCLTWSMHGPAPMGDRHVAAAEIAGGCATRDNIPCRESASESHMLRAAKTKTPRSAAAAARRKRRPKTLRQLNALLDANTADVVKKARENTKRLTGKEVL